MTLVETTTPPAYDEWAMVERLRMLYTHARQARGTLRKEWERNYRLTMNRISSALPAAAGVRANEVFPTITARIGWMTDQEISCSVTPAADPFSPFFTVQTMLGEQLEAIVNSLYQVEKWYAEVVKMLWDSAICGVGFLKAGWDQGLTAGIGNVSLRRVSPWCLYVDPVASNLDDAEYVIEVHTMTPAEIERRYPSVAKRLIEAATTAGTTTRDHVAPRQTMNNQGARTDLIPINAGTGPTTWGPPGGAGRTPGENVPYRAVDVYECWIKENYLESYESADPTKPREGTTVVAEWRVIVHSGGRVLLDELASSLFHSNRHPYVRYVDVETGTFWGSALVRDIGPCQIALNRLLGLGQNNLEYTGNPIFIGVKGSGMDRSTFRNKPGQIYDVNGGPNAQGQSPKWLDPPTLPAQLIPFLQFWKNEIYSIAGLEGGQRGEIPSGRATDKQVSATQEAGFIRVRNAQRNLQLTISQAFELVCNLVVLNYDTPRIVAIIGEEGEMGSVALAANHFMCPGPKGSEPLKFRLVVNAGATKPTSRAARIAEAVQLKELGSVDDQYVLQAFRVSHWQAVLQRVQTARQQMLQVDLAEGKRAVPRGPGTGHPH